MSIFSWLADRLILCPTTDAIDPAGKRQIWVDSAHGRIEIWVGAWPDPPNPANMSIIKFPGTAGRAERAGVHPAEVLDGFRSEIHSVNPHGYGGSDGPASIKKFPEMARSIYRHVKTSARERKILVVGNSLGCVSALFVAANFDVDGLILRNPPPLKHMISFRPRYSAWNFGWSSLIADEVPDELNGIDNAAKSTCPMLMVQSSEDRVVPVEYQDLIFDSYRGSAMKFVSFGTDHHEPVTAQQQQEYLEAPAMVDRSDSKRVITTNL